eukprot:CAMPEP_0172424796 /NCGR_PEP_ID=MMETSP1064-20121228/28319_1 /TAXON_ID=202472 /ORGANISM="Aulacoseira subarctica , Strain CCAP 1002/5" /LENGTH=319 /DNA_ID=CAMNT_0013167193 /DNA_START=423 /DNA_END=1383 /DNA_ORIENTATION=+
MSGSYAYTTHSPVVKPTPPPVVQPTSAPPPPAKTLIPTPTSAPTSFHGSACGADGYFTTNSDVNANDGTTKTFSVGLNGVLPNFVVLWEFYSSPDQLTISDPCTGAKLFTTGLVAYGGRHLVTGNTCSVIEAKMESARDSGWDFSIYCNTVGPTSAPTSVPTGSPTGGTSSSAPTSTSAPMATSTPPTISPTSPFATSFPTTSAPTSATTSAPVTSAPVTSSPTSAPSASSSPTTSSPTTAGTSPIDPTRCKDSCASVKMGCTAPSAFNDAKSPTLSKAPVQGKIGNVACLVPVTAHPNAAIPAVLDVVLQGTKNSLPV